MDHVSLRVSDYATSRQFYDAVLSEIGFKRILTIENEAVCTAGYGKMAPVFWISALPLTPGRAPTPGSHLDTDTGDLVDARQEGPSVSEVSTVEKDDTADEFATAPLSLPNVDESSAHGVPKADLPGERAGMGTHVAFSASSETKIQSWHSRALTMGATDNGKPGPRAYHPGYYAAFVIDPDGWRLEAVMHHHRPFAAMWQWLTSWLPLLSSHTKPPGKSK